MSDAYSDIARDQERGEKFHKFLLAICGYISNPDDEKYQAVFLASQRVDAVGGGYWSIKTETEIKLVEKLNALKNGDYNAWARLLAGFLFGEYYNDYQKARQLSPFGGKKLVFFDGWGRHLLESPKKPNTTFENISVGDGYIIIGLAKNKFPDKKSEDDWDYAVAVAVQVDGQWQVEEVFFRND